MTKKNFIYVASVVFTVLAVLHVLRIVNGWEAVIGGWEVPMGVSWAAIIVGAYLAWQGFSLSRK